RPDGRPVPEPAVRVRGPDDVLPRPRPEEELHRLAPDRDRERRPAHLPEVVDEDADGVEEGAQGRLTVAPAQAPAATSTQSVPKPSSSPTRSDHATSSGIAKRRQTSKSWITT